MDMEIIKGFLQYKPDIFYTKSGKMLSKVKLISEEEDLLVVAWEEEAETLSELDKNDIIIIKGYRKFNEYDGKENFIIKQFIKREKSK